ncbi:MAG: ATP-binding cassette domain-containing protein, partial [Burkholderiales bacterium]
MSALESSEKSFDMGPDQGRDKTKAQHQAVLDLQSVSVLYSGKAAVKKVSCQILRNRITAIIGPSGCGKSTLLRSLNRMNDFVDGVSIEGKILFADQD